jgi:SNF2 family DNA or RNA helicase
MIIHTETKSLLLKTQQVQAIKSLLPKYKDIDYEGHTLAVPHRLDEVRVLRNLGIAAPPPILHYYNWPGPPDKRPLFHQRETAAFLTLHPRGFCFNEMGTMKTASALWAADYLMSVGQIRKCLIVCPLSTMDVVWMEEIFAFLMHRRAVVLHGSKARRAKLLATECDFYVINHAGVGVIGDEIAARPDIDLVIGDECDVYRNAGTELYDWFKATVTRRRVWLMSGTPFPNAPTDAWALARIVNPSRVPQYFGQWRRQTMIQISQYKWVPRVDSSEMAYQACQPAVRFLKKDCIDLPEMTVQRRVVELSDEQKKQYVKMKNQAVMEAKTHKISAVNAADKINKLRQICCGVIKDPMTAEYVEIDHKPRLALLIEEIRRASTKVIVVVPFKGIIRTLEKEMQAEGFTVEILNGDVTRNQRREVITRFKNETDPHVLLCHPQVMSHGLNLAVSATIIFYGPIYSSNQNQQVTDRIARPGQTMPMTIVRFGSGALEWGIYRVLDERKVSQENILTLYKHEILGIT